MNNLHYIHEITGPNKQAKVFTILRSDLRLDRISVETHHAHYAHYGNVVEDEFRPSFPRNFALHNERNDSCVYSLIMQHNNDPVSLTQFLAQFCENQ